MISHIGSRNLGYESETRETLEHAIERFFLKPGVSLLDPQDLARHLAGAIRSWNKNGGVLFKEQHPRPGRPRG